MVNAINRASGEIDDASAVRPGTCHDSNALIVFSDRSVSDSQASS
jgi:hypothetical protein